MRAPTFHFINCLLADRLFNNDHDHTDDEEQSETDEDI
jgi:hypothetical protein